MGLGLDALPYLVGIMVPLVLIVVGLTALTAHILNTKAPRIPRGWRVAIGSLMPVMPFWCGYVWEDLDPIISLPSPDGSVVIDEGWLILTQLLFFCGVAGLVTAFPTAIFCSTRTQPERQP